MFRRFFLDGLAQASYLIADGEDAVVVDPRRDVDEYLAAAEKHGLKIRWALATHVHADFVGGLRELEQACGARIGLGAAFDGPLGCERFADGETLELGETRLRAVHTPGHTPESVSYLVSAPGQPDRLLTGDTMFVGDVGRPDLVAARGFEPADMAGMLWDSLHRRIAPLPDATEIWAAHGAGSACSGGSIGREPSATLGQQRLGNWALGQTDRAAFVEQVLAMLKPPPRYFAHAAGLNRSGPRLRAEATEPAPMTADAAARALADGAQLVDVRSSAEHGAGHWPGVLHVGLAGSFETWCGTMLDPGARLLLHAVDARQAHAAWLRLWRIGFEHVEGFVCELPAQPDRTPQIEVLDLLARTRSPAPMQVIDVRCAGEFAAGHVPGAVHAELTPDLAEAPALDRLDPQAPTAVVCAGGYRSSVATALLRRRGFRRLHNVVGGTQAWAVAGLPLEH